MTEKEWLTCDDPKQLIEQLDQEEWERELAAFADACLSRYEKTGSGGAVEWSVRIVPALEQLRVIRCLVGNPFRPVAFDPVWRTPTVTALADAIYADRAFDRLPVLADALEEAGCDHSDILTHCRGDGPHVRGCWVVDLVLGKA